MQRMLLALMTSVFFLSAGAARANHCQAEYGQVQKKVRAASVRADKASERKDHATACQAGREALAGMAAANKIIERQGCTHKNPVRPSDLAPAKALVAKLCAAVPKKDAKAPVPPKQEASSPKGPQSCNEKTADADSRDPVLHHCGLAAIFLKAARGAKKFGENDAAIGAYMQAAQEYGNAGDSAKQAEMLDAAASLATKNAKAAAPKK